ncbi:MAG TPA: CDP-alcohol phosphatidyltransferase family protein [Beijerinckiaceae bacterium]|nr:CDP-alcohol phosphatidyltransferase family protein [Beijerinckiaceae bacterium]
MLDGAIRRMIVPALDKMGAGLARRGVSANRVTLLGLAASLAMGVAIAVGWYWSALGLLGLSRLCDGLDGAVARHRGLSDFGGFLDIVCDFAFYAALPVGFALASPSEYALPATVLLASFYLNGASFLAFAAIAARRGLESTLRGPKSLYFTTGLAEGSETIAVFILMLAWPAAFSLLAYGFAGLCLVTCLGRIVFAFRTFSGG